MITASVYYQNGSPTQCRHCGGPFREVEGHLIAVHVQRLGYFCCSAHAEAAKMLHETPLERRVS
jgi:hypothetical protein